MKGEPNSRKIERMLALILMFAIVLSHRLRWVEHGGLSASIEVVRGSSREVGDAPMSGR